MSRRLPCSDEQRSIYRERNPATVVAAAAANAAAEVSTTGPSATLFRAEKEAGESAGWAVQTPTAGVAPDVSKVESRGDESSDR